MYAIASAIALTIDFALLVTQVSLLGLPYLWASAVSFLAGTVFVYWASVRHVFAYRRIEDARQEIVIFVAIGGAGLIVNLAVMYVTVRHFGMHYLLGKCVASAATFSVNFSLRRLLLFTAWQASRHDGSTGSGRPA